MSRLTVLVNLKPVRFTIYKRPTGSTHSLTFSNIKQLSYYLLPLYLPLTRRSYVLVYEIPRMHFLSRLVAITSRTSSLGWSSLAHKRVDSYKLNDKLTIRLRIDRFTSAETLQLLKRSTAFLQKDYSENISRDFRCCNIFHHREIFNVFSTLGLQHKLN